MIMSYGGLITNIVNYMTPTIGVVDLQIQGNGGGVTFCLRLWIQEGK